MTEYVDGYMLPVPKAKLPAFRRLSRFGADIWRKHGALAFDECIGAEAELGDTTPFSRRLKFEPDETAALVWIVFKSRAHRDLVNARVARDRRMTRRLTAKTVPFDLQRMVYVGFEVSTKS